MASGVVYVLTDTMMPAAERLDDPQADALEAAGRRPEAMEHLKAAAAAFADIAAVSEEPEPGIWMLESW